MDAYAPCGRVQDIHSPGLVGHQLVVACTGTHTSTRSLTLMDDLVKPKGHKDVPNQFSQPTVQPLRVKLSLVGILFDTQLDKDLDFQRHFNFPREFIWERPIRLQVHV